VSLASPGRRSFAAPSARARVDLRESGGQEREEGHEANPNWNRRGFRHCPDRLRHSGSPPGTRGTGSGGAAGVAIEMDSFTVPAGGEAYKCQNFTNPFGGRSVDVDRFEAHMPVGSHHMIVFFVDGVTDGPLEDCSGSEFHANVFGSQTPDGVIDLPKGVGVAIPPKSGLRYQLHFVNATTADAVASVTTTFRFSARARTCTGMQSISWRRPTGRCSTRRRRGPSRCRAGSIRRSSWRRTRALRLRALT